MTVNAVTQNKFRVTLTVEGNNFGVWDKKTGGKLSSNTSVYNPGGGGPQIALTGTETVDAITLDRFYDLQRDHDNIGQLFAAVGHGNVVVKQIPLDKNGHAYGSPIVWTGVLTDVQAPDHDSNSSGAALIEVTIMPNGNPSS